MEVDLDSSEDKTLIMEKSSDSPSNSTSEQNGITTVDEIESDDFKEVNTGDKEEKEDEWLDILGSGQLLKKVIKQGQSDSRPQRLDLCTVRYTGKLNDKVVDEGTVTINIGDAEVIQGLDLAVPLMDVEEEAEVIIGPRFAFGSEGQKPDIPPDATLHYTVTLLSAEPEPLLETLTLETRKEVGNRKKERGNYWYSRKDHTLAIQCYRRALEYLDDIGLTPSGDSKAVCEDEVHSLLEDRIKVYNNLAAAQIKIKAFDTALQSIDNVLRCQPNNVKALFRKGKILAEKGETEEGISVLRKTLLLDPENVQAKNELTQLLAKQKKDTAQQRKLYKKMLGGTNKPVEDRSLSPARDFQTRRWGMVVGCVGAIFSMFIAYKWYKPV